MSAAQAAAARGVTGQAPTVLAGERSNGENQSGSETSLR